MTTIDPLGFFNKRIFRLDERHVEKRIVSFNSLADPECGNSFKLISNIKEWFESQNKTYVYKELLNTTRPVLHHGYRLSQCKPTLYIDDEQTAILFKLAWM